MLETANDANAPSWSPVSDEIAFWSGIENHNGQVGSCALAVPAANN